MLLVRPGGSYWRNRDDGVWSIPKGEIAPVAGDGTRPMAA
jgi:predicted NUDIX family NTP pyrophosphohydrolase